MIWAAGGSSSSDSNMELDAAKNENGNVLAVATYSVLALQTRKEEEIRTKIGKQSLMETLEKTYDVKLSSNGSEPGVNEIKVKIFRQLRRLEGKVEAQAQLIALFTFAQVDHIFFEN
ncbi:hypothetical protein FQR65_LT08151 [Abscondita terminalis]|nr:hypothetical protein FQR65_LT08151 [Abscondita terminalis]